MNADIEALVLSGELFNGKARSSSPERSPSPDSGWHDEELSEEAKRRQKRGLDYDSDDQRRDALARQEKQQESIGMGPGRTGVKGVIRDRDESERLERERKGREMRELRQRMEGSNLGGKTFLEEEREKGEDEKVDEIVRKEREAAGDRRDILGRPREGQFGHLREVGLEGFVNAIEDEEKKTWVVVHIYDPSLDRCYAIDETLAQLARLHPNTKFLRARASSLGFATNQSARTTRLSRSGNIRHHRRDEEDEDDTPSEEEDDNVDLDMLPTMLVYRGGELTFNWVRVDWEAGRAGLEDFLDRHHILPQPEPIFSGKNLGFPSDDEEDELDLPWSDDE